MNETVKLLNLHESLIKKFTPFTSEVFTSHGYIQKHSRFCFGINNNLIELVLGSTADFGKVTTLLSNNLPLGYLRTVILALGNPRMNC